MAYDLSRPIVDNGRTKKCLPTLDFLLTPARALCTPARTISPGIGRTLFFAAARLPYIGQGLVLSGACQLHKCSIVTTSSSSSSRLLFGRVCAHQLSSSWQTSLRIDLSQFGSRFPCWKAKIQGNTLIWMLCTKKTQNKMGKVLIPKIGDSCSVTRKKRLTHCPQVRRTKPRGLKGLQLEIVARRAPQLLVFLQKLRYCHWKTPQSISQLVCMVLVTL